VFLAAGSRRIAHTSVRPMDEARLRKIPLFAQLSKRQRSRLARYMRSVEVGPGYHLVNEGEFAHQFFLIEEGKAAVIASGRHITDLGSGDFLGEIGLVRGIGRTASVITTTPLRAIVMDEEGFRKMSRSMPTVMAEIDATIESRLERDRLFGLDRSSEREQR
jgi:CRP/FNR family transcriptional regulator, cyclic AMP receptor protein